MKKPGYRFACGERSPAGVRRTKKDIPGHWAIIIYPVDSRNQVSTRSCRGHLITDQKRKNMKTRQERTLRDRHIEGWLEWWQQKCLESENFKYAGVNLVHLSGRLLRHRETIYCGFDQRYRGVHTEYACLVPAAGEKLKTKPLPSIDHVLDREYSLPLLLFPL